MGESQKHGFEFEGQIKELKIKQITELLGVSYTSKWDVPPISVKSFKLSSKTIEFGSIERVFENSEDFILVLVGWEQDGTEKEIAFSDCIFLEQKILNKLKGNLSIETIKGLNAKIKTFKVGEHEAARVWAKEQKTILNGNTLFDIRFKIDSSTQRRIQCALKLADLYEAVGKELVISNKLDLVSINSVSRIRNKKS